MRYVRNYEGEHKIHRTFDKIGLPESSKPRAFIGLNGDTEVLHILLSREEWQYGDERWHFSISGEGRVPTWDEIAETIHELRPGVPFVMGVPPRSMWLNLHDDVLHVWETKDAAMLEQWRINSMGHTPTKGRS